MAERRAIHSIGRLGSSCYQVGWSWATKTAALTVPDPATQSASHAEARELGRYL